MADLLDSIEEWLAAQAGLDDEGRTVSSPIAMSGSPSLPISFRERVENAGAFQLGALLDAVVPDLSELKFIGFAGQAHAAVLSARRPQLGPEFGLDA